jgi:DNA-binding XRE family transcriptional regulator
VQKNIHILFIFLSFGGCTLVTDKEGPFDREWRKEMSGMSFGAKFKLLREAKGLPRAGIDELFQLTPGTVSNWENGYREPEEELLPDLASFFGVAIRDLVDDAA